jgi:HD superfamily phosphohydrolase
MASKPLILRDEIHGDITLEGVARAVVDHRCFQRLRYIKQLGLAEYVFPCATHTRFQHSVGAAFLARQYFESLVETLPEWEFSFDGRVEGTEFLVQETRECVAEIAQHPPSREYWASVATLAGMLHDVGHGPWSHTFEYLDLAQNFEESTLHLTGALRAYFDGLKAGGHRIWHEDVSVLYVFKILEELQASGESPEALHFFLPVCLLVNKRMMGAELRGRFEEELDQVLAVNGIRGGMRILRLLSPFISGPFDVDRADYIQRDGRNCGVSLGGIEWRRILRKVMPCLARHQNDQGEPTDVVLISGLKNQHVLDDFVFSLYQMYAQVYLHPTIVAFEDQIRRLLQTKRPASAPVVNLSLHEALSDEAFRLWLEKEFGALEIRQMLFRQPGYRFQVMGLPDGLGKQYGLEGEGYRCVETQDRPMLKDSVGVFLYSSSLVVPWKQASAIAAHFHSIRLSSEIWIRPEP